MTSETRDFSDTGTGIPDDTAALEYTYTLGGQLASYKLPFFSNRQVSYTFDKLGRLSSAAGTSSVGNVTYASNAEYRAWGVLKALDYGNGTEMNIGGFNNKLQATEFEVKKDSTQIIDKTYQFNSDGSVKFEDDNLDAKFDRSYEYDHQARMTKAFAGAAARNETITSNNTPYRKTHQYNAFGQTVQSMVRHWGDGGPSDIYTTWANNRTVGGTTYDSDGNRVSEPYKTWKYDAAGQLHESDFLYYDLETYTRQLEGIAYDGDGQIGLVTTATQDEEEGPVTAGDGGYKVRSSVLGGQVVYDTGTQMTNVFAGGTRIAMNSILVYPSTSLGTMWNHSDPNGKSYRSTGSNGAVLGDGISGADWDKIETDAAGASVGLSAPPTQYPEDSNDLYTSGWSFGSMRAGQHTVNIVDGIHVPPEYFASFLDWQNPDNIFDAGIYRIGNGFLISNRQMRYNHNWESPDEMWRIRHSGWNVVDLREQEQTPPTIMPPLDEKKLTQAFDFCTKEMFSVEPISKSNNRYDFRGHVLNTDTFTYQNTFSIGIDSTTYNSKDTYNPADGSFALGFHYNTGKTGINSANATVFGKSGTFQTNTVFVISDVHRFDASFNNRHHKKGLGLSTRQIVTYHEVGNALATITGKQHLPDDFIDPVTGVVNRKAYENEQHSGQAFENCILRNYRSLLAGGGMSLLK